MDNLASALMAIIGRDSLSKAASKIGASPGTISHQLRRKNVQLGTLVDLAHAYDKSAIDALITAGVLNLDDIAKSQHCITTNGITDAQLLELIAQRFARSTPQNDE